MLAKLSAQYSWESATATVEQRTSFFTKVRTGLSVLVATSAVLDAVLVQSGFHDVLVNQGCSMASDKKGKEKERGKQAALWIGDELGFRPKGRILLRICWIQC